MSASARANRAHKQTNTFFALARSRRYCNVSPSQLNNAADSTVTVEDLKFFYDWIEDVDDVKMIKLSLVKPGEAGGFLHMVGKKLSRPPPTEGQKFLARLRSQIPPTLEMLTDWTRPPEVLQARFTAWRLAKEMYAGKIDLLQVSPERTSGKNVVL